MQIESVLLALTPGRQIRDDFSELNVVLDFTLRKDFTLANFGSESAGARGLT